MTQLTYKDALTSANQMLAADAAMRFIGYGLKKGRALGTLKNIDEAKIIESPVAENLMVGMAIGLALKGYKPLVFIERMDFILNALDAIVNHLDKARRLSQGEFSPGAIIRCVIGNRDKPLYTGITHIQDFSEALHHLVSFPVRQLHNPADIESAYAQAKADIDQGRSTILVEYKDLI